MLFCFLLVAVYLGTTYAEDYGCPVSMRFCKCQEAGRTLYIVCEKVSIYEIDEDLKNVSQRENLIDLTLERTDLVSLSPYLLAKLNFNHLAVQYCNLSSVQEGVFDDVANVLELLSFAHNELVRIPTRALEILSSLKYLYLDYNKLEILHAGSFQGLHSLRVLSLRGNGLKFIEDLAFVGIGNMFRKLDLGFNELSTVSALPLANLSSIQVLELHSNKILGLQREEFAAMNGSSLIVLNLANNFIRRVPARAFISLTKLLTLDLSGNEIESIDPFSFRGTESTLMYLRLDHNRLDEVPAAYLKEMKSLETLSLRFNKISTVRKNDFLPYGKTLKHIYLEKNLIVSVDPMSFACLDSLEELFLASNQLSTASNETYGPVLKKLTFFDIHGNPFHCDCEISWLRDWMNGNKTRVIRWPDMTKCVGPDEYKGMVIAEIPEQLNCPNSTTKTLQSCSTTETVQSGHLNVASNLQENSSNAFFVTLQMSFMYSVLVLGLRQLT